MKTYDKLKNVTIKKGKKREKSVETSINKQPNKKRKSIKLDSSVNNEKDTSEIYQNSDPDLKQRKRPRGKIIQKKSERYSDKENVSEILQEHEENKTNYEKILENYVVPETSKMAKKINKKKLIKLKIIKEKKANSLPAKHPDAENRTVFVGNVNVNTRPRKLKSFFNKFGKVESVRLRGIAAESMNISKKEAIATKKLHPGATAIIAYVRFEDIESKEKALAANGEIFEGLHIRVDSATQGVVKGKHSVFIGNLPFEVKDEDVWNRFKDCGKIENVRIVRSGETRAGKGIGFIAFEAKESIEMALALDGTLLSNRAVRVKRTVKKMKEKKEVKPRRLKSGVSSLIQPKKNSNKMRISFLKQDKPRHLKAVKEKHATRKKARQGAEGGGGSLKEVHSNNNFTGRKAVEEGKAIKKQKKRRLTKEEKKKLKIAKILKNTK